MAELAAKGEGLRKGFCICLSPNIGISIVKLLYHI